MKLLMLGPNAGKGTWAAALSTYLNLPHISTGVIYRTSIERVTSLVIGASSVDQLEQNVAALDNLELSPDELAEIDRLTEADGGVDVWAEARKGAV